MTESLLRPRTYDSRIFSDVVADNEYGLPDRFEPEDVILDIGAHTGAFAEAAGARGPGRVIGFEPEPANFRNLQHNLRTLSVRYPTTTFVGVERAVWRSDHKLPLIFHTGPIKDSLGCLNTGGGNTVFSDAFIPVPAISLDEILGLTGPVRLLKIDAESAEWAILFTATRLRLIREITGEYHEMSGPYVPPGMTIPENSQVLSPRGEVVACTIEALSDHLAQDGFKTAFDRPNRSHIGKFRAIQAET